MPNKIITHPPSKEYDEGWDAIFAPKPAEPQPEPPPLPPGAEVLPGGGIRMPRPKR